MSNVRLAILKAANFIEANPHRFNYMETTVPGECGSPGCAIGWVCHFSGQIAGKDFQPEAALNCTDSEFYDRMNELTFAWANGAAICAKTMRRYADLYHPLPSDTQDQRCDTPPTATTPKFDWESLAARLSREPRAEAVAASIP